MTSINVELTGQQLQDVIDSLRPIAMSIARNSSPIYDADRAYAERCRQLYNSLADRLADETFEPVLDSDTP